MNRFIMANNQQHLDCHACEIVCVVTHNDEQHVLSQHHFHPRITVIKHQQQHSAMTCHHCGDAPCTRSYLNGVISHVDDNIQVNQQKCIGCRLCVVACLFGTMQVILMPATVRKVKATVRKRDLCAGCENGPACVEDCPTDALQLVTDAALPGMAKSRRSRTARQKHQPWHASTVTQEMPVTNKIEQMQVTPARGEPDKLAIEAHEAGFDETYLPLHADQVQREASRCLRCGEYSVYEWVCPLHNHTPQWVELVKAGNIDTAVELLYQTNTLSGIAGRVCSQDCLCEGACTIRGEHGAVTIDNTGHYISGQALTEGQRPDLSHVTEVDKRMTIIGAGPAGLACVDVLTCSGVAATVYDRRPKIGGLLIFGIPSLKLDKSLLARCREILSATGTHFEFNCGAGKDVSLNSPLEQYNAVFVGVDTYRSMKAGLPDEDALGVHGALPFLITNTKQAMGLGELPGEPFINITGFSVMVLGGGDTTMDCVRTALRHGASNVICTCHHDGANMSGPKKGVRNIREGGADFKFNVQLVALELSEQGHACRIRFLHTRLDEPDTQGHRRPVPVEDSESVIPADTVITAFGFNPHGMPWLEPHGVAVDRWGRIIADVESQYRYQTMNPKIFVGGSAVHGVDLVATVMTEGRHAAQGIIDWLGVKSIKSH